MVQTHDTSSTGSNVAGQTEQMPAEARGIPGYDEHLQWTPFEAKKAVRKVDMLILPFIMLLFLFLQFDRTNIANALTDTLREDVHINNYHINLAQTLFVVGFVVTEIPFNMVSKYVGPERFLPVTMFVWGCTTWAQTFMTSSTGFYICRALIGALEGGYIPGMALYISKFYTLDEMGLRYAFFWASNSIAGALSGPLSVGLLSLRGKHGLAGWQWLFLIGKFRSVWSTRDTELTTKLQRAFSPASWPWLDTYTFHIVQLVRSRSLAGPGMYFPSDRLASLSRESSATTHRRLYDMASQCCLSTSWKLLLTGGCTGMSYPRSYPWS